MADETETNPSGSAWLTPGRFAGLLLAMVLAGFPDVVFGTASMVYRDFGLFGYPLAHYHRESFWRGELPLWNPLNNCGLPFLAQWNTLALYPFSLIYLLLPMPWALNIFCLAHLFLAGVGMYFLARRWTKNQLAAGIAGMAFAFNGLTLHCLMWPNNIAALGWMPWVVLATERAWSRDRRSVAWAALIGATQMLSGAPEIIVFTWFICGAMWVAELRITHFSFQMEGRRLGRFIAVPLLVALMAAVQLLPFLELLQNSQRDASFGGARWPMPWWGVLNFFLPTLGGSPSLHGVYVQPGQSWTSSYYLSLVVPALALLAVWRVVNRKTGCLLALAIFGVAMALGDYGRIYAWLRHAVPAMGWMRFPIKFVVIAVFCLPLLAAFAAAWLQQLPESARRAEGQRWRIVLLWFALVIVVLLAMPHRLRDQAQFIVVTWSNGIVRLALLAGAGMLVVRLIEGRGGPRPWLLPGALLAVIGLDALTHLPRQNPTIAPPAFSVAIPQLDLLPRGPGARAMMAPGDEQRLEYVSRADLQEDFLVNRLTLYGNCNLIDGVAKVGGFYSLYLRDTERALARLRSSPALTNAGLASLADFAGVQYTTAPGHPYQWVRRAPENTPLVTAGQAVMLEDDPLMIGFGDAEAPDLREVVFLPENARGVMTNRVAAQVTGQSLSAHRVEATVDSPQPTLCVMAQAWYPEWRARVDGQPAELLRANIGFQAVAVPAGKHRVTVDYEDRRLRVGGMISLAAMLGCAGFVFRKRK